ncbi:XdhC family protein [Thalassospira mesophila]|uniref:Xanthine dehydrogenase n=1 Tax=Thalassospira mesophila TaxID=1293891 RepID=A0A1Y2KW65_9PROT|nr:XdhC/CoxI family protein [Thalassospira mesophila]OSQ36019.1 hypothetical protein TMES_19135 [Thalassospira mesophila]
MNNQLSHMLEHWNAHKDDAEWVLGTIYKTEGSAYRKAGAMVLFSDKGDQFGLLSGGCIEADIQRQARKAMVTGKALTLCYDGSDEDDLSFQLGIGCGGKVHIVLQPVTAQNDLGLAKMAAALSRGESGTFAQYIPNTDHTIKARFVSNTTQNHDPALPRHNRKARLVTHGNEEWLETPVQPEPRLLIVGGGLDARPVVAIAKTLGWRVTLCDPRAANARPQHFADVDVFLRGSQTGLRDYVQTHTVDAAILMSHSVTIDADALLALADISLGYLAMLGPVHRRDQVLEKAGLTQAELRTNLAGPAGLDIGGELPESIALGILAEAHASLTRSSGKSISGVL